MAQPSKEKNFVNLGGNGVDVTSIPGVGTNEPIVQPETPKVTEPAPNAGTSNASKEFLDVLDTKPEYEQPTDTSSGASAAKGTQYSWDTQAIDAAQNQYQQDALKAKQDALANRQTIEQNALQYQQQADMMKYANNQNAEKVGWTGGYVLDQNRQMEYLKASIQAQMYGAMELQRYGYDSALSAARLSYDLNQKQFAHQYYQDAVNVAISEAQLTGTYFSAETRDMMSQLNVAEQELGDLKDLSLEEINEKISTGDLVLSAEQSKALEVKRAITDWYKANDVSTVGIKTLSAWETEQNMIRQWANEQWEMYQAAKDAAQHTIDTDVNSFIMLDDQGKPIYEGGETPTGSWQTMSGSDIINYIANEDGSLNSYRQQQFFSYIDSQYPGQISTGFSKYCETNGVTPEEYPDKMKEYLATSDVLSSFLTNKFGSVSSEEAIKLFENLNGYTMDVELPDGTVYMYRLECTTNNSFGSGNGTKDDKDKPLNPTNKPILEKTYTEAEGDKLVEDLYKDKEFEKLMGILGQIDWEADPSSWFEDVNSPGAQLLKATPAGGLVENIVSLFKGGKFKQFGDELNKIKSSIVYELGEENYKILGATYNKYLSLSDRDKALLPNKQREMYEGISAFMTGMTNLDNAITQCKNNDTNIITNGWGYVKDTWAKTGEHWSNVNGLTDFGAALSSTVDSVLETVVGGVTGTIKWAGEGVVEVGKSIGKGVGKAWNWVTNLW